MLQKQLRETAISIKQSLLLCMEENVEEEETRSSGIVMGMASLEDISAQRAKLQPAVSHIHLLIVQ